MAEQRRPIRASERARELVSGELPEEERRQRGLLLPELRLRADAPAIEIDDATPVAQALAYLGIDETGMLALRGISGEPKAIVLSAKRYLELAGKEINSSRRATTLDGRLAPVEAAFDRAHVEQVNPSESWGNQAARTAT